MSGPMQWSQKLGRLVPAITSSDQASGWDSEPPVEDVEEEEARPAPVSRAKAVKTKPPTPKNIVGLAKSRLKEIKAELRRVKALEKERDELERLIAAAADKKPRAVVRELKRNAG